MHGATSQSTSNSGTAIGGRKATWKIRKEKKNFKCVLIYEKVRETRFIMRDCNAGDVTVKWLKKLRVERGDASLLSGDKCK